MTAPPGALPDVCPSGKRPFATQATAAVAVARLANAPSRAGRGGKRPATVYECRLCNQWHVSSRTGRRQRRKQ
jgi:hypothetical protein